MNPYDVLNVPRTATIDDIKKSYRALALQHHPDKGGDEEKFKQLNQAYEMIGTENAKEAYDSPVPNIHAMFGNLFTNVVNRMTTRKTQPLVVKTNFTLEEIYSKAEKLITVSLITVCTCANQNIRCIDCQGKGMTTRVMRNNSTVSISNQVCSNCNGTGRYTASHCGKCDIGRITIDKQFRIIATMNTLTTLTNQGNRLPNHEQGDLVFETVITKHPIFELDNGNLIIPKFNVLLKDALVGIKFDFLHVSGERIYQVEECVSPYHPRIIVGKGMTPDKDLIIRYHVILPILTREQKETLMASSIL